MKLRLTESQYRVLIKEDRVTYLKNQNVVDPTILNQPELPNTSGMSDEEAAQVNKKFARKKVDITPIEGHDGVDVGYIIEKKGKVQVKVTEEVFNNMVEVDPDPKKKYVQWMLDVFARHIKEDNDIDQAVRFATEDLPEVGEFLEVFNYWKEKKNRFKAAKNRPNAPENPSDIRQYKDLAHLYSVISPFIAMSRSDDDDEVEEDDGISKLYKNIKSFVDLGQADILYHDPSVIVYVPNHIDASCGPLGPLASWCTRSKGNSYFDSYRKGDNYLRPDGSDSIFYVIMPKELFDMDNPAEHNEFPYQFHFESGQIHNKNNRSIGNEGVSRLMANHPGLAQFLRTELGRLAAEAIRGGKGLMENKYIKYLNDFGGKTSEFVPEEAYQEGVDSIKELALGERGPIDKNKYLKWLLANEDGIEILDYIPLDIDELDFSNINLGVLPDLSMFENVEQVSAIKCNLTEFPSGDKLPPNMTFLTLHDNQIRHAGFEHFAEKLKSLYVINIYSNPIETVDVANLKALVEVGELTRFAINNPRNLTNYEEYSNMINTYGEEHPESAIYADVD